MPVQIWCNYVQPFRRYWTEKFEKKIVYKMAAIGRTEVVSDVKFDVGASFIELSSTSGPNLVILALIVSKRTDRHDDGDDGVRGLCHKRLRQLRWARALKTERF